MATALALPTIFEVSWTTSDKLSIALILINLPGILLTIPCLPPEGYPGLCLGRATLMLFVQVALWQFVLGILSQRMRRHSKKQT